ncbi:hypothetical protein EMCRGX_G014475 [Ephydatia muelleri]
MCYCADVRASRYCTAILYNCYSINLIKERGGAGGIRPPRICDRSCDYINHVHARAKKGEGSCTHKIANMKLLTFAVVASSLFALSASRPPNIVILLADDLGYGDIGCYGHPTILTPNIDLLAQGGMKFTQFYSAYPICTPSRGGLMTGRLPIRNGIYSSAGYPLDMLYRVFMPGSTGGLQSDEVTIAALLKPLNYSSLLLGKWHLGHLNTMPTQRGFDEFYGLPYSQDEGCQPANPCYTKWPAVPLYHNETIIEQPVDLSTLTPRYNAKALEFIDNNKDSPFLLVMAYDEVHIPLFASNGFVNTSARGLYGDALQEMDDSVGQIVGKVEGPGASGGHDDRLLK